MYEWTEPYEDEYIKERIEEFGQAQKIAMQNGKVLVSSYEQFWLPALNDLPDVEYLGRERHRAPYGTFEPAPDVPFHGALWFTPCKGCRVASIFEKHQGVDTRWRGRGYECAYGENQGG